MGAAVSLHRANFGGAGRGLALLKLFLTLLWQAKNRYKKAVAPTFGPRRILVCAICLLPNRAKRGVGLNALRSPLQEAADDLLAQFMELEKSLAAKIAHL